jgi:hypothetical protein
VVRGSGVEPFFPLLEKMMDKTLADSYPASDPPSTLPDPSIDSLGVEESLEKRRDRAA